MSELEDKAIELLARGIVDAFTIRWVMMDPRGSIFRGRCRKAFMTIICADELSVWESKPFFVVKSLCELEVREQEKKGESVNTFWNAQLKKGFTSYPGKSRFEVRNIEVELINKFGGKL